MISTSTKEDDLRDRLKEIILSKVADGDALASIVDEHMRLSTAIGFAVGIHANSDDKE